MGAKSAVHIVYTTTTELTLSELVATNETAVGFAARVKATE